MGENINLGSFYMVGMPVAMLLGFIFNTGLVGLWSGLLAAQATCVFLMLVVLLRTDWNLQALRAKQLTGISHPMMPLHTDWTWKTTRKSSLWAIRGSAGSSRTSI
jgi:MATE family multidrug resistance protein